MNLEFVIDLDPQTPAMLHGDIKKLHKLFHHLDYEIPVMFLTGNSNRDSIVKVVSLGPADYLFKTIDRNGLIKKLDGFFEKQEQK